MTILPDGFGTILGLDIKAFLAVCEIDCSVYQVSPLLLLMHFKIDEARP